MQSIFLGRQPILDSDSHLTAYEIQYKGSEAALSRYSSASIINNVLNKFGTKSLLGDRRGFVKIDEKFLLHDIIFSIPSEFFIFSLVSETPMSERVVERIEQLYDKGYLLSIDGLVLNADAMYKYKDVFSKLAFIKLNITKSPHLELSNLISKVKAEGVKIVADDISTQEEYEEAVLLGCDWYQGYFFAEPKIIENASYEPSQLSILKLYNLLMVDTNIDEITREFELNYEVTVQLLQFINSGAFSFRNRISSIHQVLTLVGRIPLGEWLMLMIYSKSVSKDGHSPLMLMVKNRTELMQSILKILDPNVRSNALGEAYFVGVLSLIDTLFGMELKNILSQINISQEVKVALLEEKGRLGEIFKLVKNIEKFDTQAIHNFEKKHNLEIRSIELIALESMRSVNQFENPVSA